ncbi:helix-turn-helix domain-containing protein [Macrococcoides canis]|uniref:helix-turn-helix domain-containing protein n=1 Tax=Macrococcoides canis TaxID=1855823 RepID=UPI00105EC7B3|nr:helix-turn-helix transcriptional regulator [Macrococcus canis]TDM23479.1 XRE family transcriptional regulator [Macrococcus canis]
MKNRLRIIMAEKKVSLSQLHEKSEVSKTTLVNLYYERTQNPDTQTVIKVCKTLDVTPNEFFGIR